MQIKLNKYKAQLMLIYFGMMLIILMRFMYEFDYNLTIKNNMYYFMLIFDGILFLMLLINICKHPRKINIIIKLALLLLVLTVGCELYNNGLRFRYFPEVVTWPLVFINTYFAARRNNMYTIYDFPKIKLGMIMLMIFSIPMIYIHLFEVREKTSAVFQVYNCITFLPLILTNRKISKKMKNLITIAAIMIVVATTKRAGIIAFITGISLYYFINSDFKSKKRIINGIISFPVIALLISTLLQLIISKLNLNVFERFQTLSEGSGRWIIWERVIRAYGYSSTMKKLFGHGWHTVFNLDLGVTGNHHAHNDYINSLYHFGLIPTIVLVLFVMLICFGSMKLVLKKSSNAGIVAYCLSVIFLFSFASYFFAGSDVIVPLAMFGGLLIATNERIHMKYRICRRAMQ